MSDQTKAANAVTDAVRDYGVAPLKELIAPLLADNTDVKIKALKQLPLWLAGGAGAGLLSSAMAAKRPRNPLPNDENEAIQLQKYSAEKTSYTFGGALSELGTMFGDASSTAVDTMVTPIAKGLSGQYATLPHELPFYIPAAAGLLGVGAYGANRLGRSLFSNVRQENRKSEKERARKEYEEALAAFSKDSKEASDNEMAKNLERLYQHFGSEKTAEDDWKRHLGTLAGVYLAAMGGLGVSGAIKGYKQQRKADDMRKIEQAAKLEQLENQDMLNPTRVEYVQ